MDLDRECRDCGTDSWRKLTERAYPERRRDRDKTVKTVYECRECGAQGRHFDQQNDGTVQMTGALRE